MTNDTLNQEHIAIIRKMLVRHDTLHPRIFNEKGDVYPFIRDQLMQSTQFMIDMFVSAFPKLKVLDIVLLGSLCGYCYTESSDLDIFIIVDNFSADYAKIDDTLLETFSVFLAQQTYKPYLFGHPIDFGFCTTHKYMRFYKNKTTIQPIYSYGTYSLLNDKWVCMPEKHKYKLSAEEFYQHYLQLKENIDIFYKNLDKIKSVFLTKKSIDKLQNCLTKLKVNAFVSREHNALHEYSKVYNVYRIAKRLKLFKQYHELINISQEYINQNKNKNPLIYD